MTDNQPQFSAPQTEWATLFTSEYIWVDVGCFAFSMLLFAGYHTALIFWSKRNPVGTIVAYRNYMARLWIEVVMSDDKHYILAVQMQRNVISISTFLASTAIVITVGILNVLVRWDNLEQITSLIRVLGSRHLILLVFKLMSVLLIYLFCFFQFTASIRYNNIATMSIACGYTKAPEGSSSKQHPFDKLPPKSRTRLDSTIRMITPSYVARLYKRSNMHYTLGMRGYYITLLFLLWLWSPIFMAVGAGLLVIFLYLQDRNVPLKSAANRAKKRLVKFNKNKMASSSSSSSTTTTSTAAASKGLEDTSNNHVGLRDDNNNNNHNHNHSSSNNPRRGNDTHGEVDAV